MPKKAGQSFSLQFKTNWKRRRTKMLWDFVIFAWWKRSWWLVTKTSFLLQRLPVSLENFLIYLGLDCRHIWIPKNEKEKRSWTVNKFTFLSLFQIFQKSLLLFQVLLSGASQLRPPKFWKQEARERKGRQGEGKKRVWEQNRDGRKEKANINTFASPVVFWSLLLSFFFQAFSFEIQ